jgi:hypothetical protein
LPALITMNHHLQATAWRVRVALCCIPAALAACASPGVDAQWTDPQLAGNPLAHGPVFVVCEAAEAVLGRLCMDRLSADLQARGATVVTAAEPSAAPAPGQPRNDSRHLAAARAAGASTVWAATVGPEPYSTQHYSGTGVSIGLGGFSVGRGGGGVGVGVSVPVGGSTTAGPRYAADARVTDAASGRLLWTARAGSPPAGDTASQIGNLLQRLIAAAGAARLF